MGLTSIQLKIKEARKSDDYLEIEFLIDSGAVYSLIPKVDCDKLAIEGYKEMDFFLADGTKINRQVGDAYFEFEGEGGMAPVIIGEEGDEPVLGATTLESLGLILNPFKRELYPMRMLMV